jgi:hypothetical protein
VGHGEALTEGAIGVITQALGIGDGDQKEIEGTGMRAELIDIAFTDQALIDPAELAGHVPQLG